MPLYEYENPETGERIELLQSVNDNHEYVLAGVKWDRVWTVPQIAMDTKIDPNNPKQFLAKTDKPGTYGDLLDRARDLGEARAEKNGGIDPLTGKAPPKIKAKKKNPDIVIG